MNATFLPVRRTLTIAGAVAAVLLGLAAIQAAAAWTAEAAPLAVAPVSASAIDARLARGAGTLGPAAGRALGPDR